MGRRLLSLALAALTIALPTAAQVLSDPGSVDGGAECAIGKSRALTPARSIAAGKSSGASAGFDATFYGLELRMTNLPSPAISGRTRVEGRVIVPSLSRLDLDLDGAMVVGAVRTAGGQSLAWTHVGDVLSISLPAPAPLGAAVAVDIDYSGTPPGSGFGSFGAGTRSNGDPYVWSLSEPYGAREWWPSKDHPADKADSVVVSMRLPSTMRLGSNGLLAEETAHPDGTTTYTWKHRYPISTYLVSVAAGVYDVSTQEYVRPDSLAARYGPLRLPLLHYAYRGTGAFEGSVSGTNRIQGWKWVTDILPVFEHWFGPYPFPTEKYGHAHFSWGGAMEHQTMSSMTGAYVGTVAHELAHQWYGDAVGPHGWPELWLNEGFATYSELVWWRARADWYPGQYELIRNLYYGRARDARGTLVLQDTSSVNDMFAGPRVYAKGGIVLDMLESLVGPESMRTILRTWADDPDRRYRTGTTADLERHVESVTGRDFSAFFRQWVTHGSGYPVYEASWSKARSISGAWEVTVRLAQRHDAEATGVEAFEMPVELVVATVLDAVTYVADQTEREQVFTFTVPSEPVGLSVDPGKKILRGENVIVTKSDAPFDLPARPRFADVYPVPSTDRVTVAVDLPDSSAWSIEVYDLEGRRRDVVRSGPTPPGRRTVSVDLGGLASGPYVLRLVTDRGSVSRTVVHVAR